MTTIREVEHRAAWRSVGDLAGTERVLLSSTTNGTRLYLQQPGLLTAFTHSGAQGTEKSFVGGMPVSVHDRLALGTEVFVFPEGGGDTTLLIKQTDNPVGVGSWLNLKGVDASARGFDITSQGGNRQRMAINHAGQVLMPYRTADPLHFTLLLADLSAPVWGQATTTGRRVQIPRSSAASFDEVRGVVAGDTYFLVYLYDHGLYKVGVDGSVRQVDAQPGIDALYHWRGEWVAFAEWGPVVRSTDAGETWQHFTGATNELVLAAYYPVGDSLVGAYRDQLFTFRWNGPQYRMRWLNTDGLENTTINGVEVLRDTVYIATTGGLFARPLHAVFEGKP